MKPLPILIGSVYALLGLFFLRLVIVFSQETLWNPSSIFLMLMTTMNFGLFVRVIFLNVWKNDINI